MKGVLVSFEGGEATGKSSRIRELGDYLLALGLEVVVTREPGGTPLAEEIRRALLWGQNDNETMHPDTELLLVYASRAQHYRNLIEPALARGAICLTDRFADSSRMLQSYAGGIPLERWRTINDFVLEGFKPNMTLLFDLPVSVSATRATKRGKLDFFEKKGSEFHEKVREGYLRMASQEPDRFRLIDASQSEDQVRDQVISHVPEIIRLHMAE